MSFGFTLIEIMIVVVIIGILAAIVVPTYSRYVHDSRRSACESALTSLAQQMERHYSENTAYTGAAEGGKDTGSPADFSNTCPTGGGKATYNLTIDSASTSKYTLKAVPTGAQSGDKCGTLTLDQAGVKGVSGADSGLGVNQCW